MTGAPIWIGSAPHARGTHHRPNHRQSRCRFSPACAGNASFAMIGCTPASVQPRMRGERAGREVEAASQGGSAPHARGTRYPTLPRRASLRFSPACAGNADISEVRAAMDTVQPRMRGERGGVAGAQVLEFGSAPHARGTRRVLPGLRGGDRFSPACAGNASTLSNPPRKKPVQPRMRGERSPF